MRRASLSPRVAVMLLAAATLAPAMARADDTHTPNTPVTPAPTPAQKNAVDTQQGGVGGTGLGRVPEGDINGRGNSVSGPPGQGITGTAKMPDIPP